MSNSPGINDAESASTSTFVTALVFNAIVFGAELAAFTILRPYFPAIYQPRTFIVPKEKRAQNLTSRIWDWPWAIFKADYESIKYANGLDAYFFVTFLRMFARILLPIWLISWIILLPLTSADTSVANHSGLDRFIFGNVARNKQSRYWAHLILTYIFTIWIFWNIKREMRHFVAVRQRWLIDPVNARSAQASTVLITGVPQRYLSEAALTKLFAHLPGGVAQVWLNRNLKEMPDLYDRRTNAWKKLESAETDIIGTALKLKNKRTKKEAKAARKAGKNAQTADGSSDGLDDPSVADAERGDITLAEKLVPRNKRPTHRLPLFSWMPFSLPLVGKKVDSIDWAREEIATMNRELKTCRKVLARDVQRSSRDPPNNADGDESLKAKDSAQTYPPLNSAFILFNQQIAAHLAAQSLTHHEPYRMASKYINVAPEDVIWANLNMNPYEARLRTAVSWGITVGLIILWAFPVAFVGAVSNIHSLCNTYQWLRWICNLPGVVVGIISGILPPVFLALLMMMLPVILRLLARLEGIPQRTGIELSLMTRFFLFQILHSFLIVTVSSGIIAALPGLVNNPGNIPTLLAQQLPKASNFFLTYIILQGLAGTASGFLTVVPLLLYYFKLFILGSTPRSIYKIRYTGRNVNWGTIFPSTTLLIVITLAYSIISPIINGLAFATFVLFYLLYKYQFLWQLDQPQSGDTGGLFFPKAIQHVFVGLYLQQLCLAALFFLAQNEAGHPSSIGEGALMIVLIVITIFYNIIIRNSYGPLLHSLPLTLAERAHGIADVGEHAEQPLLDPTLNGQASIVASEDAGYEKAQTDRKPPVSYPEDKPRPSVEASSTAVGTRQSLDKRTTNSDVDTVASPHAKFSPSNSSSSPRPVPRSQHVSHNSEASVPGLDEQSGPKEFYHPASVEPAHTVWIPKDELGLGDAEARACEEQGVDATTRGAVMNAKGKVRLEEGPPENDFEL